MPGERNKRIKGIWKKSKVKKNHNGRNVGKKTEKIHRDTHNNTEGGEQHTHTQDYHILVMVMD